MIREAELNSAAKRDIRRHRRFECFELFAGSEHYLSVDASACEGMLFRIVAGQVGTKQPSAHGAIQGYSMDMQKVSRAGNALDIPTHPVGETYLRKGLHRMGATLRRRGWGIHDPQRCWGNRCVFRVLWEALCGQRGMQVGTECRRFVCVCVCVESIEVDTRTSFDSSC